MCVIEDKEMFTVDEKEKPVRFDLLFAVWIKKVDKESGDVRLLLLQ